MMPSARTQVAGPVPSFYRSTPERDTAFTAGAGIVDDLPQPEPRERALGGRQHPGNRHRITWTLLGHRRAEPAEHRVSELAQVLRMEAARPGGGQRSPPPFNGSQYLELMRPFGSPAPGSTGGLITASLRASGWPSAKTTTRLLRCRRLSMPSKSWLAFLLFPQQGGNAAGLRSKEPGMRARPYFWR